MSQYNSYSASNATMGPLSAQSLPAISIADLGITEKKKFPNHKITLNIYGATGGHIVEVKKTGDYLNSVEPELYIISEDLDFDRELGKIITHFQLKA